MPDSPASAPPSSSTGPDSPISCCSKPATAWAAPGTGTRIPVSPWIFRRFPISSPSSRAATGREPTHPGRELKAYAEHCVDKYGIRSRIRFNTKVISTEFDEEHELWRVQTDPGGEVTARFVISASGVLTMPNLPDIDGVDAFAGITMHTARWDHGQDLTGKRVAIIGTGASAVQVIPEIAPIVGAPDGISAHPDLVFPQVRRPAARRGPLGDADSRRQSTAAAAQPGLRRGDLPDRGAVLHGVSAGQANGVGGSQLSAPAGRGSRGARQAHPALRSGLQTARLPQHLPVHVQPRQRAAGHRADRQDHAVRGGHHRRRQPRSRRADTGDRLQGAWTPTTSSPTPSPEAAAGP